ncbi:hypothetical protein [Oryzifoliimicrobium ureilyticus]|uniref:hypothetical protein n=1 Tax=Oryzifoliimicrobium ureilyticus TaxID=3113724 RepID=UPI003F6700D3
MSSKLPPRPTENSSPKGTGEASSAPSTQAAAKTSSVNPDKIGQQGNSKVKYDPPRIPTGSLGYQMSTSDKNPSTIRQGGPGSSHENAAAPVEIKKPPAAGDRQSRSHVSSGGGEQDSHHTHEANRK